MNDLTKADEILKTAIIGAGTMGSGMALCFANAGYDVVLYDVISDQLELALNRINNSQSAMIKENIMAADKAEETKNRIYMTTDLAESVDGAQFVLEAAPENIELKHKLFLEIESLCSPSTILATNTSGLSITKIASVCHYPERVGGMHWVNPPELVPLVEVIKGDKTSEQTAKIIYEVAEKLGKVPVMVRKDVPGFGLNRLQFAVLREALHMVESGILSARDVDLTMRCGLGFRYSWLGPLETVDLGGADVFHSVASYLFNELSDDKKPSAYFNDLIAQGKLGIKSGNGFYEYEEDSKEEILRKRDVYFIRQWRLINEVLSEKG